MKYIFDKTRLAMGVVVGSFAFAVVTVAPQAVAQNVQQLESQLQSIQKQLDELKAESAQEARKVVKLEEKTTMLKRHKKHPPRMLFFRGGFTHAMQNRNGSSIRSNVAPVGAQETADKDGFYVGAGLDWSLTENAFGLMPRTSVFAELMFEYKEFGNRVAGNALANSPTQLAGGALNPRNVTVSQFTLSAAPKIKFLEGSKIRPWIIPAGLAIHVISPTSESITYLTPGVMFGAGVDYNIWKQFYVGIDGRYNLTAGKADGVRVDGMTAGGYIGIGF